MPPVGKPSGLIVFGAPDAVERVAADRGIAAGEESLAGRQVLDGDWRSGSGLPSARSAGPRVGTRWQAERRARRDTTVRRPRQPMEREPLHVGLDESDLAAERARRHAAFAAQKRAARRLEQVVARVARERAEKPDRRTCGNSRSIVA